ncbi:MAG: PEGA domain-containing protein [Deltaproteobacteria bacterium]|nr:PEGA domain-containing protein [Deltaproteobacteria bacterium]
MLVLVMLLVATTASAAKPPKKAKPPAVPAIALLPLGGIVPALERDALEAELRAALPSKGFVVQQAQRTADVLADVKALGLACDTGSVDCLVRVGALGGANVVLAGVVSPDEQGGLVLELLAVDVTGLRERGRVRVVVPKDDRARAVDSVLTGVLRPEVWRGLLRINVSQRGASVVVDGVPRGFAPLSAPIELTPGTHAVFVGLEGFRAHKQSAEVPYDDEAAVDVVLVPGLTEEPPVFSTAPKLLEPVAPVAPVAPPARKRPMRVVVYDVEATGVAPRVAQVMGTFLVAELRKREGISVLDSGELRALAGDGQTTVGDVRGCTEDQCFAEVAEALGADGVVVSQLTQIEGQVLFGLRRIDQQKQEVVGSFVERVDAADTGALLPLVGKSIAATFSDASLRAGQAEGVDERAQRVMNPPPLPALLSGSLYAGSAVAGVVGTALLGVSVVSYFQYENSLVALAAESVDVDENAQLQPLQERFAVSQVAGFIGLGTAVVLLGAAVTTGFSTDWEGYGTELRTDVKATP